MDISTIVAVFGAGFFGSLLGHLVTLVLKREEFDREDRNRWLMHREQAYSGLLMAQSQCIGTSIAHRGLPISSEWRAAIDTLAVQLSRVKLLASPAVADAADRLYNAVLDECGEVSKKDTAPADRPSLRALKLARDDFQTAARAELNIHGPRQRGRLTLRRS